MTRALLTYFLLFLAVVIVAQEETKIHPVQIDDAGAVNGQVLKYDGTQWTPGSGGNDPKQDSLILYGNYEQSPKLSYNGNRLKSIYEFDALNNTSEFPPFFDIKLKNIGNSGYTQDIPIIKFTTDFPQANRTIKFIDLYRNNVNTSSLIGFNCVQDFNYVYSQPISINSEYHFNQILHYRKAIGFNSSITFDPSSFTGTSFTGGTYISYKSSLEGVNLSQKLDSKGEAYGYYHDVNVLENNNTSFYAGFYYKKTGLPVNNVAGEGRYYGLYQAGSDVFNYMQGRLGIGTKNPETSIHTTGELKVETTPSVSTITNLWGDAGDGKLKSLNVNLSTSDFSSWNEAYDDNIKTIESDFGGVLNLKDRGDAVVTTATVQTVGMKDARNSNHLTNSDGTSTYMPFPNDSNFDRSIMGIYTKDWGGDSWGNVLTLKGWASSYSAWQISGNGSTSSTNENDFYLRSGRDATWNAWNRIWHSGDFSQSTLDNWNQAFSWGDHASAGYITSESDPSIPSSATTGQVLKWNGTAWTASADETGGDNWGSQTVASGVSIAGDGTSGSPLNVNFTAGIDPGTGNTVQGVSGMKVKINNVYDPTVTAISGGARVTFPDNTYFDVYRNQETDVTVAGNSMTIGRRNVHFFCQSPNSSGHTAGSYVLLDLDNLPEYSEHGFFYNSTTNLWTVDVTGLYRIELLIDYASTAEDVSTRLMYNSNPIAFIQTTNESNGVVNHQSHAVVTQLTSGNFYHFQQKADSTGDLEYIRLLITKID